MKFKKMNRIGTILLGVTLTAFTVAAQGHGDDRDRDHHSQGRQDYHFRPEDRGQFGSHYKSNIREVQKHPDKRHGIHAGEQLPADYRSHLKAVPRSYYRNVPPPPPGYQFGYYDGYVVAYNPTTRIVADALDLIDAATH